jgi:hypothetical protein
VSAYGGLTFTIIDVTAFIDKALLISEKDLKSPRLKDAKAERLPKYGNG